MSEIIVAVDLDDLARRIRAAHHGVETGLRQTLAKAMEAGELLIEAKRALGHGRFLPWIAEHVGLSRVQTARYMRVARSRGQLANVSPETHLTGALRVLAEPRDGTHGAWTGEVEWYTPAEHVEPARGVMGGIDLDPASSDHAQRTVRAAVYYTAEQDGLAQPWHGRMWLNPPYDGKLIGPFVKKLVAEHTAGNVPEAVLLVHARTDAQWFHDAVRAAAAVCFTRGRIAFEQPDGAGKSPTTGSAFFYLGNRPARFAATFGRMGVVLSTFAASPVPLELEDLAA